MEPQNTLIGDLTGIELPRKPIDEKELADEKNMARYTKTAEFKRIQQWCANKIAFYQKYLPNGAEVGLDVAPTMEDWRVANRVISELQLLMNLYDNAVEAVENEQK